ncbi:hypothetical protein D9M73_278650 [compost metagenome]
MPCIGVSIMPGATALTFTPAAASSSARARVAWFRPPLISTGNRAGTLTFGCMAMLAVMVTICPAPLAVMCAAAAWEG